ncbi:MAG: glycosyltransferase [Bacteroidales bacterium]|nr:glycosyltransferase [Bacteroidales bacterium]
MRKAILSVTNDLFTDSRVDKVARFLIRNGYEVTLVGRCYGDSPKLEPRPYHTHRMRLLFRRGPLFYAEYNIRLLMYLLFKKCDVLIANDLDTLWPNTLVSRIRRKRLVYDSHEYFCGEISVVQNPCSRWVWTRIERHCFPKLKTVITVSQSIVDQYEKEYGIRPYLVRNIPPAHTPKITQTKASLGMSDDDFNIILQGSGINEGRGGEETVQAMKFLQSAHLFIVGGGTRLQEIKRLTQELKLNDRVTFVPRQTQAMLFNYTSLADVGISVDRAVSDNARFSLPNKIFEYIKAGTPQVVSNLKERAAIVREYGVGLVAEDLTPAAIAAEIKKLQDDPVLYAQCKENCKRAAQELTWENEEKVLEKIYL